MRPVCAYTLTGPRVMVTGVGGAPGLDLARALRRRGCPVIVVDTDPLAAGLLLKEVAARTMPPAGDPAYGPALLELCRELEPDGLLSCVEQELPDLLEVQEPAAELGVRMWLPGIRAATVCGDKAEFAAVLEAADIPTPRTVLPHALEELSDDGAGLVVKPRRGQGAQGVHLCHTRAQARVLCELVPNPIVQQRLHGREFTADCLVDGNGSASVILRWRLRIKGGLAVVSETFHDPILVERIRQTLTAVGIVGACCAQGFLTPEGDTVMTEVNARVAGGFPLAEKAGADLTGQLLNGLWGRAVAHERLTYKPGVRLTKYTETLHVRSGQ